MNNEELKNIWIERTLEHINLVNKFAGKVGHMFPDHDKEKLTTLVESYKYYMIPSAKRTEAQKAVLDAATLRHIMYNPHHPEYWTSTDMGGFTRANFTPHGAVDATDMPEIAIVEMVADWCAVAVQKGTNTPFEWFDMVNGSRWKFNEKQQELIKDLMNKMWE